MRRYRALWPTVFHHDPCGSGCKINPLRQGSPEGTFRTKRRSFDGKTAASKPDGRFWEYSQAAEA